MKISELIESLQAIQKEHGDLKVTQYRVGRVMAVGNVKVSHMKILSNRERTPTYWIENLYKCTPENKGEKVVSI